MPSDKEDLLQSLSEEKLRDDLLLPIFREIYGPDVFPTHGPNEEGKDFVIIERDADGVRSHTAVVVKAKRLSKGTSHNPSRQLVADVIHQIETTLASTFPTDAGQGASFNKIVVVNSYPIHDDVRRLITGAMKRYPHVVTSIVTDGQVIAWIDQYMPEFWTARSGSLALYFQALAKRCSTLDEHLGIGGYVGDARKLDEIYVMPKLIRPKKEVHQGHPVTRVIVSEPFDVFRQRSNVIILGEAGIGKSTVLRAYVQRILQRNRKARETVIPIFYRARQLEADADGLLGTLDRLIREEPGGQDLNLTDILNRNPESVVLLVDGLDEIPTLARRHSLLAAIKSFSEEFPTVKVLLTSRYLDEGLGKLLVGSSYAQWTLQWRGIKVIRTFVQKWFADRDSGQRFLGALREHGLLEKLPSSPMVLTLLAILYESGRVDLPASIPELYRMFTDLLVGRWNLDRRGETFHEARDREFVLERFATELHERGETSCSQAEFELSLSDWARELGQPLSQDMLHELRDITGILVQSEDGRLQFAHLTFQEYFAARGFPKVHPDEEPASALADRFSQPWWANVVYFYAGNHGSDVRLLRNLRSIILSAPGGESARMILDFGYVLQASYHAPRRERRVAILEVSRRYAQLVESLIDGEMAGAPPVPHWLFVLTLVHLFRSKYRCSLWAEVEDDVYSDLMAEHGSSPSFKSLLALVLASLSASDPDKVAIRLLDLEQDCQSNEMLYLCVGFELSLLLGEASDIPLAAANSTLRRVERKYSQRIQGSPHAFADIFQDKSLRQSLTRVAERIQASHRPHLAPVGPSGGNSD